jgi:DNA-binding NarL/FixJ family response regulator
MARSVLIVDDSAPFRATARALLRARGYEVVGAVADGASALEVAWRLRPDGVLLDVNLPDGDGLQLASRFAGDGYSPVVVLVSMMDAATFGDRVAASGARGFVAKASLASPLLIELLGPPSSAP